MGYAVHCYSGKLDFGFLNLNFDLLTPTMIGLKYRFQGSGHPV
jgi:hypothetical protein